MPLFDRSSIFLQSAWNDIFGHTTFQAASYVPQSRQARDRKEEVFLKTLRRHSTKKVCWSKLSTFRLSSAISAILLWNIGVDRFQMSIYIYTSRVIFQLNNLHFLHKPIRMSTSPPSRLQQGRRAACLLTAETEQRLAAYTLKKARL